MTKPDPRQSASRHALIDGRSEFIAAVRHALAQAVHDRVREICLVDPDFEAWPLDDAAVLAGLNAWIRLPMRRMLVISSRFDAVPRLFPRFTEWRTTFSHSVDCRVTDVEASQVPTLLLAGAASLELADRRRWRGHQLADDREISDWREVVDALVQRSEPDFGPTTLGL